MVFHFLRLPAEIRNQIYELVAMNGGKAFRLRVDMGNLYQWTSESTSLSRLSLQRTNKQLRMEYTPVFARTATIAVIWTGTFCYFMAIGTPALRAPHAIHIILTSRLKDMNPSYNCFFFLETLILHTRRNGPSIQFVLDPSSVPKVSSDQVIGAESECRMLNSIFTHFDPTWLNLFRKQRVSDAYLIAGPAGYCGGWALALRGLKSEMNQETMNNIKNSFVGMEVIPQVIIQDWGSKKDRKRGRKLIWDDL